MKIDFGPYKKKGKRKLKMKFHNYDTWGLDTTLAMIIPPLLRQLKDTKHGIPCDMIEYEDDGYTYSDEAFAAGVAKWNAIMDKMILAFELVRDEDEFEDAFEGTTEERIAALKARWAQTEEGLHLFAQYFRNLWD